jgi:hypothetical protein
MQRNRIDQTGLETILYPLVPDSSSKLTYLELSEHLKRPNFKYLPLDFFILVPYRILPLSHPTHLRIINLTRARLFPAKV